jgi:hypothetical protein
MTYPITQSKTTVTARLAWVASKPASFVTLMAMSPRSARDRAQKREAPATTRPPSRCDRSALRVDLAASASHSAQEPTSEGVELVFFYGSELAQLIYSWRSKSVEPLFEQIRTCSA